MTASGNAVLSTNAGNGARVERGAGVAVWRQIEQILAREIAANGFGDEGRLPSEGELAKRFDVNRHTVRRAVLGLAANGLVSIEQGRGTFVQRGAIDYLIGRRTRFTENLRQQHHAAEGRMLSAVRLQADAAVAKELELRVRAPVWRIESLHAADGVALTYACNWYPAARFPDLPSLLEEDSSITHALASMGVPDYLRKWSRIGSVLPDTEIAWRLGVNRQQPVLWVENVDVDLDGVPIKYGITHFAADRVQLMVDTST
ncbi:phosphonate metabolism transcriptional regulator PhnF [Pandoraea commovens]|uniref:Phosphonate metabolism transcriptional regulator PhnF n=1 Tax=Pandoraea commovens TaxID=2508289 RepID=A0A5E4RS83_9BURK|nr:phosphonate metabolism transcriptional regulator PhnF [Pandoraea commovens]UVA77237.1 phosphonate metabolism transcriptional regulator PhnF [Pandoraea commovens]VVD64919.1 phosphonate metabolism transcriptional regulator PhnF [Pandoraea commovens]